jgi:hypothetical protein
MEERGGKGNGKGRGLGRVRGGVQRRVWMLVLEINRKWRK